MLNDLISVIIPVYNSEKYLDDCIRSVVNQTYENIEIILVDDGSTDGSSEKCDIWAETDPRIKAVHKINGGASSARNVGINVSKGEYLSFVDSDDYISENMIEGLYKALCDSDKGISYCDILRLLPNGNIELNTNTIKKNKMNVEETVKEILLSGIDTSFCNKLFHKKLFEDISFPEGEINEEYPLLIPIIKKSNGIVPCENQAEYYYRTTAGSVTATSHIDPKNAILVYKNLELIKKQIEEFDLNCKREFCFFAAKNSYGASLPMEKHYNRLNDDIKLVCKKYRKNMWKYSLYFMLSNRAKLKDKIIYSLMLFKLLRPLYTVFYRKHL